MGDSNDFSEGANQLEQKPKAPMGIYLLVALIILVFITILYVLFFTGNSEGIDIKINNLSLETKENLITIKVEIENKGSDSTKNPFNIEVRFSNSTILGWQETKTIGGGKSIESTKTLPIDPNQTLQEVTIIIDSQEDLDDTNRENNILIKSILS